MASITDKISRVSTGAGRPNSAVVQSARTVGGTSLSCDDLTNWTTDDVSYLAVYTVDTAGKIVPGSQVDFKGIVTGNTINNLVVTGGTDRAINVGDIVIAIPTAQYAKDLGDNILTSHNQDGTLKNKIATLSKINGGSTDGVLLTDASGNVTGGKVTANKIDFTTLATRLYTGPSAVTGSISLSQPATSFRSVEIEFDKPSAGVSTIVIRGMTTGTQYSLTFTRKNGAVLTIYSCIVSLGAGGDTIQLVEGGAVALNSTGVAGFASANEIRILKVTGCQ